MPLLSQKRMLVGKGEVQVEVLEVQMRLVSV
jgi:hypothetical protein